MTRKKQPKQEKKAWYKSKGKVGAVIGMVAACALTVYAYINADVRIELAIGIIAASTGIGISQYGIRDRQDAQ